MLAELGMVPTDADYPLPDRTGHGDSSTLGRGRSAPIATTEANGARQLSDEEVAFGTRLRGPLGVPERARLLDVVFDLGEASAVRILGTCVEHFAGIAECRARQFGRQPALRRRSRGILGGDEVEHVELAAGVGEEPREVTHSLEVSYSHRAPLEHHRPVVALATKADVCGRLLVRSVLSGDVRRGIPRLRDLDPLEDRARRLELQVCLVLAAAGQAGPAFAAYASGDHSGALAMFMSGVSGLDWTTCRALLDERIPGAVAQAIADADTFFGIELPSLTTWAFDAEQAATIQQPVLSVLGTETEPLWLEVAAFLRSSLPHVEECAIGGIGHLLHIQRPEPVAQAMAEFLGRHSMFATAVAPDSAYEEGSPQTSSP